MKHKKEETTNKGIEKIIHPDNILDLFFAHSIDLLCIADTNGNFIKLNPEWEKTLGYTLSDLEGKPFIQFVHPEDVQTTIEATNELANKNTIKGFRNRYRHKDGTYRWIEWRSFPSEGMIYASARDITDQIESERALKESETRLKKAQEIGRIGFSEQDIHDKELWASAEAMKIYGFPPIACNISFDQVKKCIVDLPVFRKAFFELIEQGKRFDLEFAINPADGSPQRYVHGIAEMEKDENNKPTTRFLTIIQDITRQKKAELAVRSSESILKATIESINDGLLVVQENGVISHTNSRFREIFSIPDGLVPGNTDEFLIKYVKPQLACPGQFAKRIEEIYNSSLPSEDILHLNDERKIERLSYPLIDDNQIKGRVWLFRDITEKISIEDKLRLAQFSIDNSSNNTLWVDDEARIVYVNDAECKALGYSREELIGLKVFHIDPDFPEEGWQNHKLQLMAQKRMVFQSRHKTKDGRIFPVEITTNYIDYNGKFFACTIDQNITERKKAEEALRRSEESLARAQKTAKIGSMELDLDTEEGYFSEEMYNLFGFEPKKGIPKIDDFLEAIHPDDRHIILESNKPRKDKDTIMTIEYRSNPANGPVRYFLSHNEMFYNEKTNTRKIIGTVQDITQRKKMEQDLIEARDKAERSDKLKEAFLQNMSHEIRTPLNAIVGFSELLKGGQDLSQEIIRNYTDIILVNSRQLLSIVTDVLTISSIQTGHIKVKYVPVDINILLSQLHDAFLSMAKKKNIELICNINNSRENISILTDLTKLSQILTNLINNAFKFTHEGYIEIGYKLLENNIEFYVKDTGIGIDKKHHTSIFERFGQGGPSIHVDYGGTGLGLSISKSFAELLNGKIRLESEPNSGSVFILTLPFIPFEENNLDKESFSLKMMNIPLKILIAEDEMYNYLLLESILSSENIKLYHAKNGLEAVNTCKEKPEIDIVLMDIRMPVMDGITAYKEIRKIREDIPVIAQTAYVFEHEPKELLDLGFTDYISKPIITEILLEKIAKATTQNIKAV
ncbi:MAG: PAS domain S-box protein [Bacteroidales bacterium]|nr:PAS domain S-box protein [Bacteroidales bacterium]